MVLTRLVVRLPTFLLFCNKKREKHVRFTGGEIILTTNNILSLGHL